MVNGVSQGTWFEALVEHAYDLVVVTGLDGRVMYASPSIVRILGYRPEEVVGGSTLDYVHRTDRTAASAALAEALTSPDRHPTVEVRVRHRDGTWRWLEYVLTNLLDEPAIGGIVANIRDVTARKKTEGALRGSEAHLAAANRALEGLNREKDRLVATTSHELRAPLTAIVGFALTLEARWDQLSEADKREFIVRIARQARRLSGITDDLLVIGSAHAGGMRLELGPCPVGAAIEEAIEASGLGIEAVELECPPGLRALADARRLSQIVANYLTNADRHGAPPIAVEARLAGEWVEIRVFDGGPGVPEEFINELFQPFSRADHDSATGAGTGLGLSIARELAEAQGGQAWYEISLARGACFAVRLRAAPGAAS